jgi:copper homeostasis protein (lipoprotein)
MPRLRRVFLLLVVVAGVASAGGCQREQGSASVGSPAIEGPEGTVAEFGAERVWQGVLPCSDCLGIDTRLVLRNEGKLRQYRLEETYLGAAEPNRFEREGRWQETRVGAAATPTVLFVLDPERAPRRFRLQPDGGLELLTAGFDAPSVPEYRLQRL